MLQRLVYIERFAILGGCALGPLLACLWALHTQPKLITAGMGLTVCILAAAAVGALLGVLVHRLLALGSVQWDGHEETAALVKMAIGELISNQPDSKLNDEAIAQANAQEGRATALYLHKRMHIMRQKGALGSGKNNPIAGGKRLFWALFILLLGSAATFVAAALPSLGLQSDLTIVAILLLMPLWLTGAAVAGLGMANAGSWLDKLIPGKKPPKLRPRSNKTVAGKWHNKSSRSDIPVLRIVLLAPLLIAAALYLLREYGPSSGSSYTPTSDFATDTAEISPDMPPISAATPPPIKRKRDRSAAATAAPMTPSQSSEWAQKAVQAWSYLPANGSLLQADRETLTYAGWNLDQVSSALDEAKQRINRWYLRDHPETIGKLALQLTLKPNGTVGNITVLAAEFDDPAFINGLTDRLEAISLPDGAIDPAPVVLSMDFRP